MTQQCYVGITYRLPQRIVHAVAVINKHDSSTATCLPRVSIPVGRTAETPFSSIREFGMSLWSHVFVNTIKLSLQYSKQWNLLSSLILLVKDRALQRIMFWHVPNNAQMVNSRNSPRASNIVVDTAPVQRHYGRTNALSFLRSTYKASFSIFYQLQMRQSI